MPLAETAIIQQIIAPATMIPACGLLILSSSARMNMVLARIRAFHVERINIWKLDSEPGSREHTVRDIRLQGLEHQAHRLLRRARFIRLTMLLLFAAVACNLLAVIGLATRFVVDDAGGVIPLLAMGIFMAGILLMIVAMITSMIEVACVTEAATYEHKRVEALCSERSPGEIDGAPSPRIEGIGH